MLPTGISTLCHLVAARSVGLKLPLAWLNGITGDSSADIAANPVTFLGGGRIGLAIGHARKKAGQSQSENKSAHCRDPSVCVSLYQGENDSKTRSAAALTFIAWRRRDRFLRCLTLTLSEFRVCHKFQPSTRSRIRRQMREQSDGSC